MNGKKIALRLFSRTTMRQGDRIKNSPCWEWCGHRNGDGYGQIKYEGRNQYTHRLSAAVFLDFNLDPAVLVTHDCDNPSCWRPDHLIVGTHQFNNEECSKRGRNRRKGALTKGDVRLLVYSVRSGRSSIARWAAANKVLYATAWKAYSGETHAETSRKMHDYCDERFGERDVIPF